MDDIRDSVDTVEEARKQTVDIDKVLETIGFKVKGWTSIKVYMKGKMKNFKFRNLERNGLP
jgi:hypothetical protein